MVLFLGTVAWPRDVVEFLHADHVLFARCPARYTAEGFWVGDAQLLSVYSVSSFQPSGLCSA